MASNNGQSKSEDGLIFTHTEAAMLKILSDGMRHTNKELQTCLPDELGGSANVRNHIKRIRYKLLPIGESIICERGFGYNNFAYRHVRLLASAYNGYK